MTDRAFTAAPDSPLMETTYVFDAPRQRVYDAYTDAELIPKWWGPEGGELTIKELAIEPGGSWRFVMKLDQDYTFRGVYHDVTPAERLVFTWQFEGAPTVLMQTVTFEDTADGKTKVTDLGAFQSVADRDGMMQAGMSEGSLSTFDRLAKLL